MTVQSVDRALDILESLAEASHPMGIAELSASTGLADGTVHRLLRTLVVRGYARQDASRKYSLGGQSLRLGRSAERAIANGAQPFLTRLMQASGETANLAVLEGSQVVYVAQVPSAHSLRMFTEVGRRVLPHSTAVGKVLLAWQPPEIVDAILTRTGLPRKTPTTITSRPALLAELERVRAQGFAIDNGEEETGVRCMAVPVRHGTHVVAAMSVSGPSARFAGAETRGLVKAMHKIADEFATRDRLP